MSRPIIRRLKPKKRKSSASATSWPAFGQRLRNVELELVDLRSRLAAFQGRYLRQVGALYAELDEWKARISELGLSFIHLPPRPRRQRKPANEHAGRTKRPTAWHLRPRTSPHLLNSRGCTVKQPNASILTSPQIPPIGSVARASWQTGAARRDEEARIG